MFDDMYQFWWTAIITSVAAVMILFLLTKLMGKRQIAQLSLFDYINGITIGSIAAELATLNNGNYIRPLIALVVYCLITLLISVLNEKSIKARKLFSGQPMVLFDDEEFYYNNLKKSKIDLSEFLTLLRYEGYFDLADVQTAVLETNGMISILPVSTARPVTPEDLEIKPSQDKLVANVVMDGKIMPNVLRQTGNDEQWLRTQLDAQGVKLGDCVLGTVDGDNVFTAYEKIESGKEKNHPFI